MKAANSGMIIVGGGVVKHHICNANLMVRRRLYLACYLDVFAVAITVFYFRGTAQIMPSLSTPPRNLTAATAVPDPRKRFPGEKFGRALILSR